MYFRRLFASSLVVAALAVPLAAQWPAAEKLDLDALYRIKDEGLQRSKVMEIESYLTDVYGPRLTGSPNIKEAADWAQKTMTEWGLANVHVETWPFGRGWQNQRFVASALTPRAYPLIAYPKAWTPGTKGPVSGEAVMAVIATEKDFDTYRGKLRGKFVLGTALREVPPQFEAPGHRYTDAELAEVAKQPDAARGRGNFADPAFTRKKNQFWIDEGVAGVLDISRGDGGTLFVQSGGARDAKDPPSPPQIVLAVEHYGRIARTLDKKIPVALPGFQFIQDEIEYNARTHHSNMDTYERVQANDMMRNAAIVASFVVNAANRDEKLPRKPLPKAQPPVGRGTSQP